MNTLITGGACLVRLVNMANALDVSPPYFFEEMSAGVSAQTPSALMKSKQHPEIDQGMDPLARRETLALVRLLSHPRTRRCGSGWRN
jgi:hypothetical protein